MGNNCVPIGVPNKQSEVNQISETNYAMSPINNQETPTPTSNPIQNSVDPNLNNQIQVNSQSINQETNNMINDLKKKDDEIKNLKDNIVVNKQSVEILSNENKKLENEKNIIQNDFKKIQAELIESNKQLNQEKDANQKLIKDVTDMKNVYAQKEQELQNLQKNYNETKTNYDNIFHLYNEVNSKYAQIQSQYNDVTQKYNQIKAQNDQILPQYSQLQTQHNSLIQNNNQLKSENVQILTQYKQIQTQNNALLQNCNQLNTQINIISQKNNQLQMQYQDVSQKNNQLKSLYDDLKKKYEEVVPITVGLDNIGATCYMNATLQSLSNVKELTSYFLKKYQPNDPNKRISNEYYQVVKNLWNMELHTKSYAPHSFKKVLSEMNPMFAGVAANDSKDLINFLLETFHSELNSIKAKKSVNNYMINPIDQLYEKKMLDIFLTDMKLKYDSPISTLFYGVLETQSKCTNCQRIKYNFQIYSFIEFPLEQINNHCFQILNKSTNSNQNIPEIDIYDCFHYYQHPTPMTGENQIYCNECGKTYDALYQTVLYSMPNYLIINLNRGKNAVFQCTVKFPELLKLHSYVIFQGGKTVFQLTAVICHHGPSSMSGHFIAYCRHYKDNSWYIYNDSIVQKCKGNKDYLNGMPYILFYKALDD